MSFSPTITHQSQAIPGVSFTVRRMGFSRRTEIDLKTLKLRQRQRELEIDNPPQTEKEKELTEAWQIAGRKVIALQDSPEECALAIAEADTISAELGNAADPETRKQRAVLNEEYTLVESQIRAEWIRFGLLKVEGGELDGMTAEQLLDYGSTAFALEVYAALMADGKLSGAEAKNSPSPTTSGAVAGGENQSTDAPPAEVQQAATT